ncbi:hypothetical protein SAMN05421876_101163 [Kaistella jeonii]|nr:hypothetical protein SAMN05421876_101163 [Kaistella jeonii]VEI94762.1 Uncharacterised protein [Kaistella jeonii]
MKNASLKNNINSIHQISLIGKTKEEIIEELGDGFNFYPDNLWDYELGKNWWGTKKVLFLLFEDKKVKKKTIRKVYGKVPKISIF